MSGGESWIDGGRNTEECRKRIMGELEKAGDERTERSDGEVV